MAIEIREQEIIARAVAAAEKAAYESECQKVFVAAATRLRLRAEVRAHPYLGKAWRAHAREYFKGIYREWWRKNGQEIVDRYRAEHRGDIV